ncbi:hypothetical protein LJC71_04875 [Desulfosarcina sp. OttesenSCG-928-A07]|nr:hypothetical protein [Desulfosarcina sp. OttesenSCG-928-G17]MDL2329071.1 hypothetical protein [Desulfosarcina sp. OttesenSCG-928-A07]
MSFIGAVAASVRKILADYSKDITLPCLIIGAGNFTVPSVLRSGGYTGPITACDVSLYTSALGAYLGDWTLPVSENPDAPEYLRGLLRTETPAETTASISLLMDLHEVWQAKNPWQVRMIENYRRNWDALLEKTLEKLERYKDHITPITYQARDGFDLLEENDPAHTVFAFPPTYKGGYEKLERLLKAVAVWEPPSYREMTDKNLDLYKLISRFDAYYVVLEKDLPEVHDILGKPSAILPRGRDKYTYIVAKQAKKIVIRQSAKAVCAGPIWKSDAPVTGSEVPGFAIISRPQSLRLNELYLSKRINYYEGAVDFNIVLTLNGRAIGKADFIKTSKGKWKLPDDTKPLYIMCDLAVSSCESRLAKLVLLLMQSKEVKSIVDAKLASRFGWLTTTAFSDKPVSMKYRGIFKLYSRKENKKEGTYALNYFAEFGKRTLQENFDLWKKKYHRPNK